MSGPEIVEEWRGKRVGVQLARGGFLKGEVVRSDAVGMMLAVEGRWDPLPEGGWMSAEQNESSLPMFGFVPWAQIEMVIPSPGELP